MNNDLNTLIANNIETSIDTIVSHADRFYADIDAVIAKEAEIRDTEAYVNEVESYAQSGEEVTSSIETDRLREAEANLEKQRNERINAIESMISKENIELIEQRIATLQSIIESLTAAIVSIEHSPLADRFQGLRNDLENERQRVNQDLRNMSRNMNLINELAGVYNNDRNFNFGDFVNSFESYISDRETIEQRYASELQTRREQNRNTQRTTLAEENLNATQNRVDTENATRSVAEGMASLTNEQLEARRNEIIDIMQYDAHHENGMEQNDDNLLAELQAIDAEIANRKAQENVNPYENMTNEEIEARIAEILSELEFRSHYENGMEEHNDNLPEEYSALKAELDRRNGLGNTPNNGGPYNDGPNNDGPNNDGPNNDGPNNDGPNNDGPNNDGPNNDGPNNDGPNNDEPNDARDFRTPDKSVDVYRRRMAELLGIEPFMGIEDENEFEISYQMDDWAIDEFQELRVNIKREYANTNEARIRRRMAELLGIEPFIGIEFENVFEISYQMDDWAIDAFRKLQEELEKMRIANGYAKTKVRPKNAKNVVADNTNNNSAVNENSGGNDENNGNDGNNEDKESDDKDKEPDDKDKESDDNDLESDDKDLESDDKDKESDDNDLESDDKDKESDDNDLESDDKDLESDDKDKELDDKDKEPNDNDLESSKKAEDAAYAAQAERDYKLLLARNQRIISARRSRAYKATAAGVAITTVLAGASLLTGGTLTAAVIAGGLTAGVTGINIATEVIDAIAKAGIKHKFNKVAKKVNKIRGLKGKNARTYHVKYGYGDSREIRFVLGTDQEVKDGKGIPLTSAADDDIKELFADALDKEFASQNDPLHHGRSDRIVVSNDPKIEVDLPRVDIDNLEAAYIDYGGYKDSMEEIQLSGLSVMNRNKLSDIFKRDKSKSIKITTSENEFIEDTVKALGENVDYVENTDERVSIKSEDESIPDIETVISELQETADKIEEPNLEAEEVKDVEEVDNHEKVIVNNTDEEIPEITSSETNEEEMTTDELFGELDNSGLNTSKAPSDIEQEIAIAAATHGVDSDEFNEIIEKMQTDSAYEGREQEIQDALEKIQIMHSQQNVNGLSM